MVDQVSEKKMPELWSCKQKHKLPRTAVRSITFLEHTTVLRSITYMEDSCNELHRLQFRYGAKVKT